MEESKPIKERVRDILTYDLTHIFIVFTGAVVIATLWFYFEKYVHTFLPITFDFNLFILLVAYFLLPLILLYGANLFPFATWLLFQTALTIIILIFFFVVIGYFIIFLLIENLRIEIKRTRYQNIGKGIALYMGIGTGVLLVLSVYPIEAIFNFNFLTVFILNIKEYIFMIFQFVFMVSTSGLMFGYIAVLINDLGFGLYRKITKKRLVRKIRGYEYTTKIEYDIESKVKKILHIKFYEKSKFSKVFSVFFLFFILFSSFFILKMVLSKNSIVHVRFSNPLICGGSKGLWYPESQCYIVGVGILSSSLPREAMAMVDWQQISTKMFQYGIPIHIESKPMLIFQYFAGNMEFTFQIPKNENFYGLIVWILYKVNGTEEYALGVGIVPNYFENSILPKVLTIHGFHVHSYYGWGTLSPQCSHYPLYTIEDGYNLFDYLFYW